MLSALLWLVILTCIGALFWSIGAAAFRRWRSFWIAYALAWVLLIGSCTFVESSTGGHGSEEDAVAFALFVFLYAAMPAAALVGLLAGLIRTFGSRQEEE